MYLTGKLNEGKNSPFEKFRWRAKTRCTHSVFSILLENSTFIEIKSL